MNMLARTAVIGCAAVIVLLAAGCGTPQRPETLETHDHVVSFAPNLTEIVFALGQGDRVIGVSSYCDYPPDVAERGIPKLGGHFNPNLERLAVLAPDLVLLQGEHARVSEFARLRNIRAVNLPIDSLETLDQGIADIGALLACEAEADELRRSIREELDEVAEAVADLPRPRVLIITARPEHRLDTLFTVGGASFMSELVGIAGGENIFQDARSPYFEASKETVVVREPEVVIEFHPGAALDAAQQERYRRDWQALPSLPAVRDGRIHFIVADYALIPGPRVVQTARMLARLLHPGVELPE